MDMHPIAAQEHLDLCLLENEAKDLVEAGKALEGLLCLRNVRQVRGLTAVQYREALTAVISGMRSDLSRALAEKQAAQIGGGS